VEGAGGGGRPDVRALGWAPKGRSGGLFVGRARCKRAFRPHRPAGTEPCSARGRGRVRRGPVRTPDWAGAVDGKPAAGQHEERTIGTRLRPRDLRSPEVGRARASGRGPQALLAPGESHGYLNRLLAMGARVEGDRSECFLAGRSGLGGGSWRGVLASRAAGNLGRFDDAANLLTETLAAPWMRAPEAQDDRPTSWACHPQNGHATHGPDFAKLFSATALDDPDGRFELGDLALRCSRSREKADLEGVSSDTFQTVTMEELRGRRSS